MPVGSVLAAPASAHVLAQQAAVSYTVTPERIRAFTAAVPALTGAVEIHEPLFRLADGHSLPVNRCTRAVRSRVRHTFFCEDGRQGSPRRHPKPRCSAGPACDVRARPAEVPRQGAHACDPLRVYGLDEDRGPPAIPPARAGHGAVRQVDVAADAHPTRWVNPKPLLRSHPATVKNSLDPGSPPMTN